MRGVFGLALTSTLALAGSPARSDAPADIAAARAPEETLGIFENAAPVPEELLGSLNAKAQINVDKIQINDQDVTGVVTGNTAIGSQNGNNAVSEGAFSDSAGFMTTIQNTGNNVLIQNATIVNISMEP
jgi:hypothetical protein